MNERIKELAEQSGWGKGETQDDCIACSTFDPEKFAELIVRDCALTASIMEYEGRTGIGAQLLDNFEVKSD